MEKLPSKHNIPFIDIDYSKVERKYKWKRFWKKIKKLFR